MKRWILLGLLACGACGGSDGGNTPDGGSNGPGSVSGTIGGKGLTVKDAIFGVVTTPPAGGAVVVVLGDRTGLCAALASNPAPTGSTTTLEFALANVGVSGIVPLVKGPYTFVSPSGTISSPGQYWLLGTFQSFNDCALVPSSVVDATGGSVSVTQVGNSSASKLKADFSMTFGADSVSGTVNASYCAALETATCGLSLRSPAPALQ